MGEGNTEDIDVIHQAVVKAGGKCSLTQLGPRVKNATGIKGRLIAFMEKNSDRLAIERLENGQIMTHAVTPKTHQFSDHSLGTMFHTLYRMTLHYRKHPWPKTTALWKEDYSRALRLTESPSKVLFELKSKDYVKELNGGNTLKWDVAGIYDAVNQMPQSIRLGTESNPQPPADTVLNGTNKPAATAEDTALKRIHLGDCMAKSFTLQPSKTRCIVVDEMEALKETINCDPMLSASIKVGGQYAAIDCEGVPETLELLQVATASGVYIFDCRVLGPKTVCGALKPFLTSENHFKLIHDLHRDAVALQALGSTELMGIIDTQLVAEHEWGKMLTSLNGFLKNMSVPTHSSKEFVHAKMKAGVDLWSERPIPKSYLEYAALDVSLLLAAAQPLSERISDVRDDLIQASEQRFQSAVTYNGLRSIGFDKGNHFSLASSELLKLLPSDRGFFGECLKVECEVDGVVSLLPVHLQAKLTPTNHSNGIKKIVADVIGGSVPSTTPPEVDAEQLSEIFLDLDRRAQCWAKGKRHFLSDDSSHVVRSSDLKYITDRLGEFGGDNRAGLNSTLHRFSAMRDRFGEILGISIRIGRHVRGNAAMLMDFLLGTDKSILVLGEPGSGKTTIVREATRILAKTKNVIVVDTSNEIAGDGRKPHSCIGLARRMMVPSLEKQSSVLIECVQNHTPDCIVIDEIGRPKEVHAARTAKQRGVRLIASAHGDLRNLIKNKELNGLVGGTESVTIGDEMAREEAKRRGRLQNQDGQLFPISKTKVQRGGDPTFEVVIEVRRGARHEWRVVVDSARAVDSILDLDRYKAQLRTRNAETGEMQMELIDA